MRSIVPAPLTLFLSIGAVIAQPAAPLDVDVAFAPSLARNGKTLKLRWTIEPRYYLYRDNVRVTQGAKDVPIRMSDGIAKEDPSFGTVDVIFR